MKLQFNLGPIDDFKKQTPITLDMAFYLVDGSYVGDSSDKCYIPIFVTNPGENVEAATHWFLGNMFMDRYFVANDWNVTDPFNKEIYPKVGIYDKFIK